MRSATVGTLATDGVLFSIGILTGSLAARLLLPEGRGALAAVLFWPQLLAGIGLLTLNDAVTYRVGKRMGRISIITASGLWLTLILSVMMMLVGYVLIPFLLGEGRSHLWSLARMYLLYIPFNFVALGLLARDQGALHFRRYNILRMLVPLFYLVGLVSLWVTDQVSVSSVVVVNCAGTVLVALVGLALQGHRLLRIPSLHEMIALLRLARRFHPATILLLLAGQADQFVVLTLWDDGTLGRYVVALTVASAGLSVVSGAFQKVLFPHLANVQEPDGQLELFTRGVRQTTMATLALFFPLAFLIPWVVPRLFGPAFQDVISLAWVLLAVYVFVALKTILIQSLRGLGSGQAGSMAAAINLGVFLVMAWPLGIAFGPFGVAAGLGLANTCAVGYLAYYLRQKHNVTLRQLWGLSPKMAREI